MAASQGSNFLSQIQTAIINNQPAELEAVLKKTDINICLNNYKDSPLLLAIKESRRDIVRVLLSSPDCDLAHQNINYYSPLDLALVVAFDKRKDQQSECWDILELLVEAGSEPACPDAMLYVIRNALKLNEDEFIFRLIETFRIHSSSLDLHALLLKKLHRHQPMYSGSNYDMFFESASELSVKLIKQKNNWESLQQIVNCFSFYADSHWDVREKKISVFIKLIIYLSVAGWKWTDQSDIQLIMQICPSLAEWCIQRQTTIPSLTHLCRVALTSTPTARNFIIPSKIPQLLEKYLNFTDIDELAPFGPDFEFNSIPL